MPAEYDRLRQIILRVRDMGDRGLRASHEELAKRLLSLQFHLPTEKLEILFPPKKVKTVQIPAPEGNKLYRPNEGLVMPPLERHVRYLPVVCFRLRFADDAGSHGTVRIFLMSCAEFEQRLKKEGPMPPLAFVLRLENGDKKPTWGFNHCQVCDEITPYKRFLQPLPDLLPAVVPRIPIAGIHPTAETVVVS